MKYTVMGAQMKQIDRDTMDRIGIPSMVLMERAALAVADAAERMLDPAGPASGACSLASSASASGARSLARSAATSGGHILAVCGTGNNGADGIAAGRILHGRGYDVTVLLAGDLDHATPEHRAQQQIARSLDVTMVEYGDFVPGSCDLILDAVFGIGLGREVEGEYRELLDMLSEKRRTDGAKVVAVDIPSGIHSDTGAVMGTALAADVTVTFGYVKTGLMLYPGRGYGGTMITADIGFSRVSLERAGWDTVVLEPSDRNRIPERRADGNKGTFGKLLIIAGSEGMSGAAYLSALAAYRTGVGLVKLLTVPENRTILQTQLPEAIVETFDPEEISSCDFGEFLKEQCDWADAIVLGPGLGRKTYVESLAEAVLSQAYVPMVLDADGLNAVAAHPYLTRYFTENIVITPHMGEMARLCACSVEELKADPVRAAREYSGRYGVVCVMKDAATVTADKDGTVYVNPSGCSAMAKAGSGDVLSGVIAGLLARGMECAEAAAFGVYLHGLAGEAAAGDHGENGLLARNIADFIGRLQSCRNQGE